MEEYTDLSLSSSRHYHPLCRARFYYFVQDRLIFEGMKTDHFLPAGGTWHLISCWAGREGGGHNKAGSSASTGTGCFLLDAAHSAAENNSDTQNVIKETPNDSLGKNSHHLNHRFFLDFAVLSAFLSLWLTFQDIDTSYAALNFKYVYYQLFLSFFCLW